MAIFRSIVSNLETKTKKTARLFFNQYRYSLRFKIANLWALRSPVQDLDGYLDSITNSFYMRRNNLASRFVQGRNPGGNWSMPWPYLTDQALKDLLQLASVLHPHVAHSKLQIYGDWGYLYSNDVEFLIEVANLPTIYHKSLCEAEPVYDPGSVGLRNPNRSWRSYFRETRLDLERGAKLKNFLLQQQDIDLCPSLKQWTTNEKQHRYTRSSDYVARHWFLDHDESGILLMIELVCPNVIRKTLPIIKVNN